jgi:prevent-host-death family protein
MDTIGAYEAKTHLPKLLERVLKGESIVITRHGSPVAILQPMPAQRKSEPKQISGRHENSEKKYSPRNCPPRYD